MKILFSSLLLISPLTGCGGIYRYPCQDPANARTSECSCESGPRTKNKAFGLNDPASTTTTIPRLVGFDC